MGWGGGKRRAASSAPVTPAAPRKTFKKVTVYQVLKDNEEIAEFADLTSARIKAVESAGRIKIITKTIEVPN